MLKKDEKPHAKDKPVVSEEELEEMHCPSGKKDDEELEEMHCPSGKKDDELEEKLDAVGKEDGDIDNDGDQDDSDEYLANRRKAIAKAIKKQNGDK